MCGRLHRHHPQPYAVASQPAEWRPCHRQHPPPRPRSCRSCCWGIQCVGPGHHAAVLTWHAGRWWEPRRPKCPRSLRRCPTRAWTSEAWFFVGCKAKMILWNFEAESLKGCKKSSDFKHRLVFRNLGSIRLWQADSFCLSCQLSGPGWYGHQPEILEWPGNLLLGVIAKSVTTKCSETLDSKQMMANFQHQPSKNLFGCCPTQSPTVTVTTKGYHPYHHFSKGTQ